MADLKLREITHISIKPPASRGRVSTIELVLEEYSKWYVKTSNRRVIRGIERDSDYDGEINHDERETERLVVPGDIYEKTIREQLKPVAEQLGFDVDKLSFEELNVKAMIGKKGYLRVGQTYEMPNGSKILLE